eukprot:Hpha_TRINITY_DN16682_c0_g1::TRINITY_DN16682_c0_g1_i10::g.183837::m.183837
MFIQWLHFSVEAGEDCIFDYLEVQGATGTRKLCGGMDAVREFPSAVGSTLRVTFKSDSTYGRTGFRLRWKCGEPWAERTPAPPPPRSKRMTIQGCKCRDSWYDDVKGGCAGGGCCNPNGDPRGVWCMTEDPNCGDTEETGWGYCTPLCEDTCALAKDGRCDEAVGTTVHGKGCPHGTDCSDCGNTSVITVDPLAACRRKKCGDNCTGGICDRTGRCVATSAAIDCDAACADSDVHGDCKAFIAGGGCDAMMTKSDGSLVRVRDVCRRSCLSCESVAGFSSSREPCSRRGCQAITSTDHCSYAALMLGLQPPTAATSSSPNHPPGCRWVPGADGTDAVTFNPTGVEEAGGSGAYLCGGCDTREAAESSHNSADILCGAAVAAYACNQVGCCTWRDGSCSPAWNTTTNPRCYDSIVPQHHTTKEACGGDTPGECGGGEHCWWCASGVGSHCGAGAAFYCAKKCRGQCDPRACDDTCASSMDGECDDGGEGSTLGECELGTDCTDCGPRDRSGAPAPGAAAGGPCYEVRANFGADWPGTGATVVVPNEGGPVWGHCDSPVWRRLRDGRVGNF